jgi:hypothetical protein
MPSFLKDRKFWAGPVLSIVALMVIATYAKAETVTTRPKPVAAPAEDLGVPYLKAPVSWTGCYIGPTLKKDVGIADPIFGVDGYAMGFMGGCDVKVGALVVGGFGDYDWQHFSQFGGQNAREWSFGARVGIVPHVLADNTLIYGLVSRPQLQIQGTTVNGLGIGGGIETQITKFFSVALEYRHNTFDDLLPGMNAREDTFGLRGALRLDIPTLR